MAYLCIFILEIINYIKKNVLNFDFIKKKKTNYEIRLSAFMLFFAGQ